jgi:hypothetical protein
MQIRHVRPAVLEVTLHAYELSALIAAARWAVEGGKGDMPSEALEQLKRVLAGYEGGLQRSRTNTAP